MQFLGDGDECYSSKLESLPRLWDYSGAGSHPIASILYKFLYFSVISLKRARPWLPPERPPTPSIVRPSFKRLSICRAAFSTPPTKETLKLLSLTSTKRSKAMIRWAGDCEFNQVRSLIDFARNITHPQGPKWVSQWSRCANVQRNIVECRSWYPNSIVPRSTTPKPSSGWSTCCWWRSCLIMPMKSPPFSAANWRWDTPDRKSMPWRASPKPPPTGVNDFLRGFRMCNGFTV